MILLLMVAAFLAGYGLRALFHPQPHVKVLARPSADFTRRGNVTERYSLTAGQVSELHDRVAALKRQLRMTEELLRDARMDSVVSRRDVPVVRRAAPAKLEALG